MYFICACIKVVIPFFIPLASSLFLVSLLFVNDQSRDWSLLPNYCNRSLYIQTYVYTHEIQQIAVPALKSLRIYNVCMCVLVYTHIQLLMSRSLCIGIAQLCTYVYRVPVFHTYRVCWYRYNYSNGIWQYYT